MTLHFHWLHAPRWMGQGHIDRAITLVLGVIGVSLLLSALRIVDAAFSGGVVAAPVPPPVAAASAVAIPAEATLRQPVAAPAMPAAPVDATLDMPEASVEAISL